MGKPKKKPLIKRQPWEEFQKSGLLWFINSFLHAFGWAIVLKVADEKDKGVKPGKVLDAFPARVRFRGFDYSVSEKGYERVARFLVKNAGRLYNEAEYKGGRKATEWEK